jgi:hypothetical protein
MKRILFFAAFIAFLMACTKDKFKTVPQVKITSFGPAEVVKGQIITLRADVTDKEGDVQDSVIFYRKIYNATTEALLTTDSSIRGTLKGFGIPTKTQEFELQLQLSYGEQQDGYQLQNNGSGVDRKISFGIYVKDKAGNRSEYTESDKIVMKKI